MPADLNAIASTACAMPAHIQNNSLLFSDSRSEICVLGIIGFRQAATSADD